MISNEVLLGKNIGTMSDKKWNDFFTIMAENNVYDKTLN